MKIKCMKYGCLLLGFTLLLGCSSTSNVNDQEQGETDVEIYNSSRKLSDYLRSVGGVTVHEINGQTKITIRGNLSFNTNTDPLFVIDGVRSGYDYSRIESIVPVQNIRSVRVLKGSESSTLYGIAGSNGAIVISTKR